MMQHQILDERLRAILTDEPAEQIATGFEFSEGPVWDLGRAQLTFSDIPGRTIHRWSRSDGLQAFRNPSGGANGNTLDPEGNLLTCEHENRRVSRTLGDGSVETVASHFLGKRLNSPNDLVCSPNGDVFFTDPPYGLRQPNGSFLPGELSFSGVFCLPAGAKELLLISDALTKPNGLVFDADASRLLVDDTDNHVVHFFDLAPDKTVLSQGTFAQISYKDRTGRPDGMKLDSEGNLYVAANGDEGVWVFDPAGALMGFLALPEPPSNLAWGEDGWHSLFITAATSVYRLPMKVSGQPLASRP